MSHQISNQNSAKSLLMEPKSSGQGETKFNQKGHLTKHQVCCMFFLIPVCLI